MPLIMIMINYELLYLQSLYEQSILSMFHVPPSERSQFSLCINCCLRFKKTKKKRKLLQDFYKNVCFCTRTRGFVVLCITVALLLWIEHVAEANKQLRRRRAKTGLRTLWTRLVSHPSASWGRVHTCSPRQQTSLLTSKLWSTASRQELQAVEASVPYGSRVASAAVTRSSSANQMRRVAASAFRRRKKSNILKHCW